MKPSLREKQRRNPHERLDHLQPGRLGPLTYTKHPCFLVLILLLGWPLMHFSVSSNGVFTDSGRLEGTGLPGSMGSGGGKGEGQVHSLPVQGLDVPWAQRGQTERWPLEGHGNPDSYCQSFAQGWPAEGVNKQIIHSTQVARSLRVENIQETSLKRRNHGM